MSRLIVTNIGQLITMAGPSGPRPGSLMSEIGVIDGPVSVVCEEGKIVDISRSISSQLRSDVELDAAGAVVTPGLVDAHTHFVFAKPRLNDFELRVQGKTYADISAAGGGIRSSMQAVREASLEELTARSIVNISMMQRAGTTTAEVKTGYGLEAQSELKMLRASESAAKATGLRIVKTFLGPHAVPPEFADPDSYLTSVIETQLPMIAGRVSYCDMFVEEGYFGGAQARRYAEAVHSCGLKLRLHVDQMRDSGGAAMAAALGAVTADHLEYTGGSGISALANSKTMPVILPASVQGLGKSKYPDGRAMIDAGLPLVLASDFNPGSSPCPSLPQSMHLACLYCGVSVAEALTACTINAAVSLGLDSAVGSIETDKCADMCIWDIDDYRELAYWSGTERLVSLVVGGEHRPVR